MWTFYILFSPSVKKYYIGFTGDDILQRLRRHNSNHKGFTGKGNDWQIAYTEIFTDKTNAHKRELEVKSWKSKRRIEQLIGSAHSGS